MDWFKLNARASCPYFKCFENRPSRSKGVSHRQQARREARHRLKAQLAREVSDCS